MIIFIFAFALDSSSKQQQYIQEYVNQIQMTYQECYAQCLMQYGMPVVIRDPKIRTNKEIEYSNLYKPQVPYRIRSKNRDSFQQNPCPCKPSVWKFGIRSLSITNFLSNWVVYFAASVFLFRTERHQAARDSFDVSTQC